MLRRNRKNSDAGSKGLAIVEFVVVLPICLMLLLVVGEFGRAFMQYNVLTKSARDAIRYVAANASPGQTGTISITGTVQTETQNLVVYGNTGGTGSAVLPGLTAGAVTVANAGGGNVSVSVSYPYAPMFTLIPGFSYGSDTSTSGFNLQTAVTMRAL